MFFLKIVPFGQLLGERLEYFSRQVSTPLCAEQQYHNVLQCRLLPIGREVNLPLMDCVSPC